VEFTKVPPREVYVYSGTTVKLEWEYSITGDKKKAFARYSPTWNLYDEEGEMAELASEDMYNSWKWMVSATCPASLRGRISKQSSANLIITKVTTADSGTYGCTLELASGDPLTDKVQLIVTGKLLMQTNGNPHPGETWGIEVSIDKCIAEFHMTSQFEYQ
jgi:hypothetical protein